VARDPSQILDALLDGIVVVDVQGRIQELNQEACRILRGSAETLVGSRVEAVLGPDHTLVRLLRSALSSGSSAAESGRELDEDVSVSPLFDGAGRADGAVAVLRDRSLKRSLESRAAERERLDVFGRIAAGLAHEIKNPLAGIQGAGELIALRAREDKTRETAELVVREAQRIASLVDDFMVFSEHEELRRTPTNLHRVLDGALDLLAMDPVSGRARVERLYDPSLPELLVDPDRLTQVFLNLGRNALQALEGSGTLSITTRMPLALRLGTTPTVTIEFRDTGPGIPAERLAEVRTPFVTTRAGGTGLGLAVAEYWTLRHGGTLDLESTPGEGTRARVTLPTRRPA